MSRIEADIALESWLFGFRPIRDGQFTIYLYYVTNSVWFRFSDPDTSALNCRSSLLLIRRPEIFTISWSASCLSNHSISALHHVESTPHHDTTLNPHQSCINQNGLTAMRSRHQKCNTFRSGLNLTKLQNSLSLVSSILCATRQLVPSSSLICLVSAKLCV